MAYTPYQDVTFQTRYSLTQAPAATLDGSGAVLWDIWSQVSANGSEWTNDQHWTIVTPSADLETVLVMADGTPAQKAAKNNAAIALLAANINTSVTPQTGNTTAAILERTNANGRSAKAATGMNTYLTETLSLSYPVPF